MIRKAVLKGGNWVPGPLSGHYPAEVHIWICYSKLYFKKFLIHMYVVVDCSNVFSMIVVNSSKVKIKISDPNFQNATLLIKAN